METIINYSDTDDFSFGDFLQEIERINKKEKDEIILIANVNCDVVFSTAEGPRWMGISSLNQLQTDPDLCGMLEIFNKNKINFLTLEIAVEPEEDLIEYKLEITKLRIEQEIYFLLVFQNLDRRNKIERKINNLTFALDYGKIPVIIADKNQEIIYASTSFEELLGLEIENIFRNNLSEILSKYLTFKELEALILQLREHGVWKKTVLVKENKDIKYYEFKIQSVYYEEQEAYNYILTANDISDHILRRQEIKRSEAWLNTIINSINELLIVFYKEDDKYFIKKANQNFKKILNIKDEKGVEITKVFDGHLAETITANILKLENEQQSLVKFETDMNSDKYYYEVAGTLMLDAIDLKKYFVFTFTDISERIAYERQLEKAYHEELKLNEMKNDFLENMSHEVRTPAHAIIGFSDILYEASEENDLETVKEISLALKDAISRMVKTFDNIVEVATAEPERMSIDLTRVDCNFSITRVAEKFESVAIDKGLNLIVEPLEQPVYVHVDWVKLDKVLTALLDNAIKYTESGRVIMRTYKEEDKGIIDIIDTGSGIELNKIPELLKPFQQGESGYTRNFQGAGLGLTLAYRLTILMKGKLQFFANESRGTVARLIFPEYKEN